MSTTTQLNMTEVIEQHSDEMDQIECMILQTKVSIIRTAKMAESLYDDLSDLFTILEALERQKDLLVENQHLKISLRLKDG